MDPLFQLCNLLPRKHAGFFYGGVHHY
ncbi:hypothetical protein CCACVL1_17563 [Corchorus capsularis]|uniref:Uncharacterized protein n=1 Tax=Corchorus capsularis TaxID=210143 RepID=A0A1R3HR48_COCAP|nr:hypothetical protein CCACVL1_17563 [Corchorus capsularis]